MSANLILFIVATIGGIAVVVQAQFTGMMQKGMGTLESVFLTYSIGGALIALIMLLIKGGNLQAWRTVPWYALLAGVLGLVIIGAFSYVVPRLGLVPTFTIFVATQFILGAIFDHYGVFGAEIRPFTTQKFIGILTLLTGVWLIIR
jgi:transporter family-2 protein